MYTVQPLFCALCCKVERQHRLRLDSGEELQSNAGAGCK